MAFWPKKKSEIHQDFCMANLLMVAVFPLALPYETDGDAHWKF